MQESKKKENEVGNKLSDFEIIKELGKGSYGTVYTVKSLINSNVYVMKKMEINHLKHRQQQECYREVSILKKVSHKNIIKYYSSFLEQEILYIIMEYAELGDLYSLIKHYKKHSKYFDENDLWKISTEILSGLEYLHSQKIIHRDIKCLNLFITKDRHVKIGDLGVSTITSGMDNLHYTRVGTPLYISPELVKQKPYDYKTDIWSFGCSLYHLASLEPPFTGGNLIVLGNNIVRGVPKSLPHQYSNELRAFIDKMLEKKPENRPSAKEALEMIPKEIKEKINTNGEKFYIKSKRPFSSAINKVIAVNKDEIRNIFGDNIKNNNKNKEENITNINNDNISKKSLNHLIKNNNSSGKIITIHNLENSHNNINQTNENKLSKENELKINDNKKLEFFSLFNSNGKDKPVHRNKENNIEEDLKYDSIGNGLKKSKNISVDTPSTSKKGYDISFNIPSFYNQKGFNKFRTKKKKSEVFLLENKNSLGDKFNSNYNYLKVFSPIFKNSNNFFEIKSKKHHFTQKNVIEPNIKENNAENKINIQNNIKEIIEKNKNKENKEKDNKEIPYITDSNININCDNKNINIININNNNNNINSLIGINNQENKNNNLENEQNKKEKNSELKKDLIRLNTDISKIKNKEKLKFPELSIKDKTLKNIIKKSSTKNNIYSFMNQNITNITNNRNIYKRLTSAKPNSRSFSNNRPFTSKINKNQIPFNGRIKFNNDTFNNVIRQNNMLFYTKDNSNSDSHRYYAENKTTNAKKMSFRPMTGVKPQINNNVMNININFYNIDMNKRFLIPGLNPYYSGNEISNGKNMEQWTEESIIQTKRFKDNIINNMDLQSYKNSNEFIFEKIMKAIKDIKGDNKRLTINDLK